MLRPGAPTATEKGGAPVPATTTYDPAHVGRTAAPAPAVVSASSRRRRGYAAYGRARPRRQHPQGTLILVLRDPQLVLLRHRRSGRSPGSWARRRSADRADPATTYTNRGPGQRRADLRDHRRRVCRCSASSSSIAATVADHVGRTAAGLGWSASPADQPPPGQQPPGPYPASYGQQPPPPPYGYQPYGGGGDAPTTRRARRSWCSASSASSSAASSGRSPGRWATRRCARSTATRPRRTATAAGQCRPDLRDHRHGPPDRRRWSSSCAIIAAARLVAAECRPAPPALSAELALAVVDAAQQLVAHDVAEQRRCRRCRCHRPRRCRLRRRPPR